MFCGVDAAVMYELMRLRIVQFSNHAVDGPKMKSVVPSIWQSLKKSRVFMPPV